MNGEEHSRETGCSLEPTDSQDCQPDQHLEDELEQKEPAKLQEKSCELGNTDFTDRPGFDRQKFPLWAIIR